MNRDVWLFPQNSCNMEQFFVTLKLFGQLNGIDRKMNVQQILMEQHSKNGVYRPYSVHNLGYDMSSANHKIDEPRFYGAIYETTNKKIHVSTYGELLIKYSNDIEKRNKIFFAMLYNIQFDNPYKKMENFDLYPIRLIFQLMLEPKIENKLTNIEIALILYNVKKVKDLKDFEKIVNEILNFRNLSASEKLFKLTSDSSQFIINYVSCNYLINMLCDLNLLNMEKRDYGYFIQSLKRKDPTKITERTLAINNTYLPFIVKYSKKYTVYEETKKIVSLRNDWIRDIYNNVSEELLVEIGENEDIYTEYIQIPKMLLDTSINSDKWSIFEEYITKSFNLFEDVDAETIGGPGEPDSLCFYRKEKIHFVADGKSTNKKLSSINDGRLLQHRQKYKAMYTIIVTPSYVPGALRDINGANTCIITSYCFSDLITKYIFKLYKNREECSYEVIHNLILNNLGTDISEKIYSMIDERLGIDMENLA